MSDDHIKSEISSYLAGGLTESRNRQIEAHAASCEKCRNAMTKAKAKQARVKREALKKASSDPLPNLFLARQGKTSGIDRASSSSPWLFLVAFIFAGAGYGLYHHFSSASQTPPVSPVTDSESGPVEISSAPVAVSVPVPVAPVSTKPPPEPVKPAPTLTFQKEWKGSDSGIQDLRVVVVRKQSAWDDLWAEMKTEPSAPAVNFDEHVVVGVFGGEHPAGSTLSLGRPEETDEDVQILFRVNAPGVAASTSTATGHPYILAVLPRVDKKIRLSQKETSQ